jgi:hypothetical protein
MRLSFDDGTLLLEDAPESVPYAEWDDRVDEFRAQAQHYREMRAWANSPEGQATLEEATASVTESLCMFWPATDPTKLGDIDA